MNAPTEAAAVRDAPTREDRGRRQAELVAALRDLLPPHALLWQRDAAGAGRQSGWARF